ARKPPDWTSLLTFISPSTQRIALPPIESAPSTELEPAAPVIRTLPPVRVSGASERSAPIVKKPEMISAFAPAPMHTVSGASGRRSGLQLAGLDQKVEPPPPSQRRVQPPGSVAALAVEEPSAATTRAAATTAVARPRRGR